MTSSTAVMGSFLQRHAYANVWCSPSRDKQIIFQLARLTPIGGVWINADVLWSSIMLPNAVDRFHVYQIGQIHPLLLGLLNTPNTWLKVSDTCNSLNFLADLYTDTGLQIHRTQAWYRITQEKNLIVAIRIPANSKFQFDLDTDNVYMRLYSNDYYKSAQGIGSGDVIHVNGLYVTSNLDVINFQNEINTWLARHDGAAYYFLNGNMVETINLPNSGAGDYIEYVYDGSIKQIQTFNVGQLPDFLSTLDSIQKYLLHYAAASTTIDAIDDIDLYLVLNNSPIMGQYRGVYFHKNNPVNFRQVTHKDYSVSVQALDYFVAQRPELGGNAGNTMLVMIIRKSGYNRALINDVNHIEDLYRMSDTQVLGAMVGVNATVANWTAATLEASPYVAVMRAPYGTITPEMVTNAYGYNTISKIIGDIPVSPTTQAGSPANSYLVPIGYQQTPYTAYEYDANGLLLGYQLGSGSGIYTPLNATCNSVEFVFGTYSSDLHSVWNAATMPVNSLYNYRFYTCGLTLGQPNNNWIDVTGSSVYAINGGTATWLTNPSTTYTAIRNNAYHLLMDFTLLQPDGLLRFNLLEHRSDLNEDIQMSIPLGRLDVFLNGHSLIEGVDYFVRFPTVTIFNKKFLINPLTQAQHIVARFTDFCNSNLSLQLPDDVGFVQYGVLSYDSQFETRSDRINRIVVGGQMKPAASLTFAENSFLPQVSSTLNGTPYAISRWTIPVNNFGVVDSPVVDATYDLLQIAKTSDAAISDYLTLKLPQPTFTTPSTIGAMYKIYSPFFCKVIYDLWHGALTSPLFVSGYSDNDVNTIVGPYLYLLDVDPLTDNNAPDRNFVLVEPHNLTTFVTLGIYQYKFLTTVVRLFGNNQITLSGYVNVEQF